MQVPFQHVNMFFFSSAVDMALSGRSGLLVCKLYFDGGIHLQ